MDAAQVGDTVRALVISVDVHSEKVYLSMNNARMKGAGAGAGAAAPLRLGPYRDASHSPHSRPLLPPTQHAQGDSPVMPTVNTLVSSLSSGFTPAAASPYSVLASPAPASFPVPYGFPSLQRPTSQQGRLSSPPSALSAFSPSPYPTQSPFIVPRRRLRPPNFLRWLRVQPLFLNPAGLSILLQSYAINQYGSLLPPLHVPPSQLYHALRHTQNQQWARDSTMKGIGMAKRGHYDNALKVYAHALEIEPRYVQAYVARGACYVLQGRWEEGVKEFETALSLDPEHAYARQYLAACRDKMRKMREEKEGKEEREGEGEGGRGGRGECGEEAAAGTASSSGGHRQRQRRQRRRGAGEEEGE